MDKPDIYDSVREDCEKQVLELEDRQMFLDRGTTLDVKSVSVAAVL